MSGRVAVTGATGFIGKKLIHKLTSAGWAVRALTRKPQADRKNLHWITGTLEDKDALDQLVAETDYVIHCAGRVRGSSSADFLKTNLDGTANLLDSVSSRVPHARFLLVSSLAAREPQLSWYADSKFQAEQYLIRHAGMIQWTIFRPTAVYGPGDREMAPLFRATRIGLLPLTGAKSSRFGLLYVNDLVEAILSWLNADEPVAGIYELDDGTPGGYDHDAVKQIASQVWTRPVHSLPVPASIISAVARANLALARLFRYSPMLTPGKVRELQHTDWVCDSDKLTRATGWRPKRQLQDALHEAVLPLNLQ